MCRGTSTTRAESPFSLNARYAALKGRSPTVRYALPSFPQLLKACPSRSQFYRFSGSVIVFPSLAERRAASRISVTVTFVSNDDKASGLAPSTITART
jgi:hypothetical protein